MNNESDEKALALLERFVKAHESIAETLDEGLSICIGGTLTLSGEGEHNAIKLWNEVFKN